MIRCVGVEKAYRMGARQVAALRGVDLEIGEPGFYAIMGQSGSGKSTLLHLLAALDWPDKGEIEVAGTAVHLLREPEATRFRRSRVGIVFQQFNLIPTLTALENVELPGMLAGQAGGEVRARAEELLGRLGLGDRAGHRPDALSGGEQQRVAIARALLFRPALVLADEPTGNLDSTSAGKLWRLLADLSESEGTWVLMVTHEAAAAANCRRVFVLSDGRVTGRIEVGSKDGVLDASGVATRYQQLVRTA